MSKPICVARMLMFCAIVGSSPVRADLLTLPPMQYTLFCIKYPAECRSTADRQIDEAQLRQLQNINSLINSMIVPDPHSDHEWNVYPPRGDCGDFAVTKRHAFLAAGWPSSRLLLAEVVLRSSHEHHLLLIVIGPSATWVLDNLRDGLLSLGEMRQRYFLVRAQTTSNPNIWATSWNGEWPSN
ncbi:transglutaminase-like cysteine peptidase [Bradyrhizobium commune]|uniref:Transglutaminase-like cysteine peptidase n=1 Tax=Bradyrhizobium commune TaxID=83627 RepID=A0A7S9D317_9BRAD|nr:transglutaminase-like cysteine peptidase [Bradyrhizobium commune]QPF90251.1 transglutaminase-like cysteine peptidase [Bradyrhizobium commune]